MVDPTSPEYSKRSFWNDRFRDHKGNDDWYATWEELKPVLAPQLPVNCFPRVLMVGCGSSKLSAEMQKDGYFVTNVDISDVVVRLMAEQSPAQEFLNLDATCMPFRAQAFDLVIDKGTFDALISAEDSSHARLLVQEIGRVSASAVVLITYGKPEQRSPFFLDALSAVGQWEEATTKCRLSSVAQFVNIVRSRFPGETMATVMKDSAKLKTVMVEYVRYMKGQEVEQSTLRQDHCWVYIYQRLQ